MIVAPDFNDNGEVLRFLGMILAIIAVITSLAWFTNMPHRVSAENCEKQGYAYVHDEKNRAWLCIIPSSAIEVN